MWFTLALDQVRESHVICTFTYQSTVTNPSPSPRNECYKNTPSRKIRRRTAPRKNSQRKPARGTKAVDTSQKEYFVVGRLNNIQGFEQIIHGHIGSDGRLRFGIRAPLSPKGIRPVIAHENIQYVPGLRGLKLPKVKKMLLAKIERAKKDSASGEI